ncbi:Cytochrome b561 and DOMON domain-containing protein [Glycine max]|nr:Cytochrome b561 and DOMON domain-containing protein [Glycine max]
MLIAWAEMIGTKAIIAIKRSDGTWGMDTHTTSPRRPENACSPLPSKIAFVTNKSVANMNTMNARILVLPSDVYKLSWDSSKRRQDLTYENGRSTGQYQNYLRSVFGFQMLAFRLKPKVTDGYRKYWNMYHHFLRYGLLAITYCYIFKGINILEGGDAKHNAFA